MAKLMGQFRNGKQVEIVENTFLVDGYSVADRLLEGVMFICKFEGNKITSVECEEEYQDYFNDLNTKKFLKLVEQDAQTILDEGDEVEIPFELEQKYKNLHFSYIEPDGIDYFTGESKNEEVETNPVKIQKVGITTLKDMLGNG